MYMYVYIYIYTLYIDTYIIGPLALVLNSQPST